MPVCRFITSENDLFLLLLLQHSMHTPNKQPLKSTNALTQENRKYLFLFTCVISQFDRMKNIGMEFNLFVFAFQNSLDQSYDFSCAWSTHSISLSLSTISIYLSLAHFIYGECESYFFVLCTPYKRNFSLSSEREKASNTICVYYQV